MSVDAAPHPIDVPGRDSPVDVPDDEFRQGPPEVDVDGRVAFGDRSPAQQVDAWRKWLSGGRDLVALDDARRAARRATEMVRRAVPAGGVELRRIPERMEGVDVDKIVYGNLGDIGPGMPDLIEVVLSDVELDLTGPPDQQGAYDPAFRAIGDPDVRKERWRRYLAQYPKPPEHYADAQLWFLRLMDRRVDDPDSFRVMDALGLDFATDPKKSWAKVLGVTFLTVGGILGGALGGTLGRVMKEDEKQTPAATPVGAPTGLTVTSTPTPSGAAAGHDVTVTWVAPTTGPQAERWDVTCTPVPAAQESTASVTGSMTSAVVAGVAAGKYLVTVVGVTASSERGTAATLTVAIPTPAGPPQPATAPDPPTAVTLTADLSSTSNLRGLTVAWTPATTGPRPTGYSVLLQGTTMPPIDVGPVSTGPVTSCRFEPSPPGRYQAIVVATIDDESSAAVTSAAAVLTALPAAVPDVPRNLTTHVFASATSGKAALTVTWDPPAPGTEVAGYDVGLTGMAAVRRTGRARSTTWDPVPDGSPQVVLTAYNAAGRSKPLVVRVEIDHTKLDADGVSWAPVLARTEIDALHDFMKPFTAMDEKTFWGNVMRALADTAGVHGGLASYPTMLFLARLLALWITVPATPPTETQVADMAAAIAAAATFPTAPPESEFADRMAPWRAAQALVSPVTKKSLPVRYKIFGLVRALERYLGEHK